MKTQKEIENLAKEYAGIAPHIVIDEEERYYNEHACKVYDAFIAGYKAANEDNIIKELRTPKLEEIDGMFDWRETQT